MHSLVERTNFRWFGHCVKMLTKVAGTKVNLVLKESFNSDYGFSTSISVVVTYMRSL